MLAALQHLLAGLGIHLQVNEFLVLFGLLFTRIAVAIVLAPFLGGRSVTARIKIGLALVVSLLLFSSVAPQQDLGELTTIRVMSLLVKEGVIGATLGFLAQIVFYSVQMAGAMVDYGRGMSQATFFAPQLESNVSLLGQLQFQAALVLFLILNGHLLFLRGLAASFNNVPLLSFPNFFGGTMAGAEQVARYTAQSLVIAIQLSAPALLALFLTDVSFGMLGKVASGLNVHNESQPVKAIVGLGVILLGMAYIFGLTPGYFSGMMQNMDQLMRQIQ